MAYLSITALRQSLGAYLHQDWGLDYATAEEAIEASAFECADPQATIAEIDELLSANLSEIELWAFIAGAGCFRRPEDDGRTCREFLQYVRETFAARADA